MENRKGNGIFLGVIGVATLIVAIIGATFAFFGANAFSNATAIGAKGALLKLGYTDNTTGLKYNLIPATDIIALYSAMSEEWYGTDESKRCKDEYGNEICGVYTFSIGNPSVTTRQNLFGSLKVSSSDFENLQFAIFDETGKEVMPATNIADEADDQGVIALTGLATYLLPSTLDDTNGDGTADTSGFVVEDPDTYTRICRYGDVITPAETNPENPEEIIKPAVKCTETNIRDYTLVLWIREMNTDQTEADSNKVFAAGITFTSAQGSTGVTGVISGAKKVGE